MEVGTVAAVEKADQVERVWTAPGKTEIADRRRTIDRERVARLALRLDLDHRSIVLFRQELNQSVGALADVTHPLMEILQHRFPALLPQLVVEDDPFQVTGARN